jgi:hypothetical protein
MGSQDFVMHFLDEVLVQDLPCIDDLLLLGNSQVAYICDSECFVSHIAFNEYCPTSVSNKVFAFGVFAITWTSCNLWVINKNLVKKTSKSYYQLNLQAFQASIIWDVSKRKRILWVNFLWR